ncbi:MAG: M56 family metallopeptidase [Xanthomonadales bacterium]|nr:M56 family metallopeptidase [Xanthomonadales bacterium]
MSNWPQFESLVSALGWTLIHFLWQGLCVAGFYWLICRLAAQRPAAVRYWAGMVSFVVCLALPALTFSWYYVPVSEQLAASAAAVELAPVYALNPSFAQILSAGVEPALPIVVALWAVGVMLLSARAFVGWLGARRLVSRETAPVAAALLQAVRALEAKLGIRRAVSVVQSKLVDVPTVVGWLKPVILLPASVIARLPSDQLEMVIAHELGHVKRFDYLFNLFQILVETLFFYHPAIRWMSREVRQEREHCCDDLVVNACGRPVVYARALANIESLRGPQNVVAMAATGGDLVHRVRRIVRREIPRHNGGFAQVMLMFGLATVVALSAHQGLEISRQIGESQVEPELVTASGPLALLRDRGEWSSGLDQWPGLSEIRDRLEAQRRQRAIELAAARAAREESQAVETKPVRDRVLEPIEIPDLAPAHEQFAQSMLASTAATMPTPPEPEEPEETWTLKPDTVVAPVYPFKARRKRVEGHVRLEFSINRSGEATDIRVVEASPPEMFEESAIKALEKWAFHVDENHSENTRVFQVFDFAMEEDAAVPSRRDRRCEIAGSRICGLKRYDN